MESFEQSAKTEDSIRYTPVGDRKRKATQVTFRSLKAKDEIDKKENQRTITKVGYEDLNKNKKQKVKFVNIFFKRFNVNCITKSFFLCYC